VSGKDEGRLGECYRGVTAARISTTLTLWVDSEQSVLDSLAHGVEIAEIFEQLYGPPRGDGGESERSVE
jgi:hypothetical protein